MKILYLSNSIIPSRTANSINVMKMCQALAKDGHEVTFLAPNNKDNYKGNVENIYKFYAVEKNFEIKRISYPNINSGTLFYIIGIFFYLLFNRSFDLVYGRFLYGCYIAALLKNDVIFESHAPVYDENRYSNRIFELLIKNKFFKKLIVISKALKNIYLQNGYLDSSKIQVAHDGADETENFNSKIELLGCKKNLKVGYVGHLYKGKGMEIIDLISKKLDNDVEIHIIGGLEKDIYFWKNKITSKKVYFYGFVEHKEVSKYINALDVCLLPNQKIVLPHGADSSMNSKNISTFTSPLKLFEYMSHKKAIIASNLPVIREVLNEKNSMLVECDNVQSWINSINKLKNLENRESICNQALSDFYDYTWKKRAMNVINEYINSKPEKN
jgi:glycosyltransferase involved in cell wall biosynthesis